jgi:hypothetical protein
LGGWGTHVMDAVCYALQLGYPERVELLDVGDVSEDRFPRWSTVRYDFPQRGDSKPVPVFWHEGSKPNTDGSYKGPDGTPTQTRPHLPPVFSEIERLDPELAKRLTGAGNLFVGDQGIICCGSHGGNPVLSARLAPPGIHSAGSAVSRGRAAGSWATSSPPAEPAAARPSPASPPLPVPSWKCCWSPTSPCAPA